MARFVTRAMVVLLLVAVLSTFTACSIFEGLFQTSTEKPEVKEVKLSVVDGLEKQAEGTYQAVVGDKFSIKATINDDAPSKVTYKWYIKSEDGKKGAISGASTSTLAYTFDQYSSTSFEFWAEVDGVKSTNTIIVTLQYAPTLANVTITSSTHSILDGAIQQEHDNIETITLVAEWNKSALPEDTEVTFEWTMDNTVLCDKETFDYTPAGVGTHVITLTMSDGTTTLSTSVMVNVIEVYSAVSTATLAIESGATPIGEGATVQYYQLVEGVDREEVTITLSTTPIGKTDLDMPVTWTVRDESGQRTLSETGRTLTFEPAYGENIVTATVGGVVSKQLIVFAFTELDYTEYEDYIKDVFVWDSGVENGYVIDQTDLNRFMQHALSTRKLTVVVGDEIKDKSNGFPFANPDTFDVLNDVDHKDALSIALGSSDEAGGFNIRTGYSYYESTGQYFDYVLYVTDKSVFMNPTTHFAPASNVTQDETALLHYKMLDNHDKRTVLPIDDNPEYPTAIVDSQMLYRVVGWGYKPKFDSSPESQKMLALYKTVRQVAIDYVTDDMTDYEKALIFYEWIAQKTDYDYALVETEMTIEEKLVYNAFSLEGVFADADGQGHGQAVCDGRAKAYVILCGLEDIKAVRVTGQAFVGGISEGHAWNKVLIDVNNDGVKEWFICDTTWSDRSSAEDRVERLNKQYFLVTDGYVKDTHIPDAECFNPPCVTSFDYYKATIIENGNKDFDLFVDGYEDLKNAIIYARDNGILLEIKVSASYAKTASELAEKIKNVLFTNGGGSIDGIIPVATASTYGIYTIVF